VLLQIPGNRITQAEKWLLRKSLKQNTSEPQTLKFAFMWVQSNLATYSIDPSTDRHGGYN